MRPCTPIATLFAIGLAWLAVFSAPARAQSVAPEAAAAAQAMQRACVARGEAAAECACGVGLAYARLDSKVFLLVPQIEPLLDEKNTALALVALSQAVQQAGLTVADGMRAYEAIRDNRAVVDGLCKPLAQPPR